MPIEVTVGEKVFRTDDLTLDEAILIQKETGHSWFVINPLQDPAAAKAIQTRFLAREYGEEEAAKRAGSMTVRELVAAVKAVDDDLPDEYENGIPLVEDVPATSGSSGARGSSTGRRMSSGASPTETSNS